MLRSRTRLLGSSMSSLMTTLRLLPSSLATSILSVPLSVQKMFLIKNYCKRDTCEMRD